MLALHDAPWSSLTWVLSWLKSYGPPVSTVRMLPACQPQHMSSVMPLNTLLQAVKASLSHLN